MLLLPPPPFNATLRTQYSLQTFNTPGPQNVEQPIQPPLHNTSSWISLLLVDLSMSAVLAYVTLLFTANSFRYVDLHLPFH